MFALFMMALRSIVSCENQTLADLNSSAEVYIGFYIESLGDLRASAMAYDVDMYLQRSWQDASLAHSQELRVLRNDSSLGWQPDIYFSNAKTAIEQDVTIPNKAIYIYPDGTISYSSRVTLNMACTLRLEDYPLDKQRCFIKIMSYGYPDTHLRLLWFPDEPITYNPDIDLAEFDLMGMSADNCSGSYKYAKTKDTYKTGIWSCLMATIYFQRSITFHLVETYIPTAMIVMISWVSFWIDRTAVPARVSLGFTTLLTLSTMGTALRYSLPAVSYAKAIDYWYGVCMLFVFAALLEFAIVNSLMRRSQKYEQLASETRQELTQTNLKLEKLMVNSMRKTAKKFSRSAFLIDKTCRVLFPCAFLIYNALYWSTYAM